MPHLNPPALKSLPLKRWALGAAVGAAVALPALTPTAAHAWWRGGWGWTPGVVVVAPPVVYAPPPPVAYVAPPPVIARPYARWVPGHYDWRGYWIPAHWA